MLQKGTLTGGTYIMHPYIIYKGVLPPARPREMKGAVFECIVNNNNSTIRHQASFSCKSYVIMHKCDNVHSPHCKVERETTKHPFFQCVKIYGIYYGHSLKDVVEKI